MPNINQIQLQRLAIVTIVSLVCATTPAWAKDIYVSVTGSDANSGSTSSSPLRTILAASDRAYPGDTVWIMPGEYAEPIKPFRTGKPGSPITYRAAGQDSPPVIKARTAIVINGLSYIVVDGVAVNGGKRAPGSAVDMFADVDGATNITIRNCDFRNANGYHGVRIRGSKYVTLEQNTIDYLGEYRDSTGHAYGDTIGVDDNSAQILIRDNDLRHGGHNLINMNGSYSVVRGNFMDNSWRDVYGGEAGYRSASIKGSYNVFEDNHVARNGVGAYLPSNVLVKVQGEFNIARRNVLANAIEQAIESDSGAASPVSSMARIYHNTFYNLGSAAWRVRFYLSEGKSVGKGVFANNIVHRSRTAPKNANQDTDVMFLVADAGQGPTASSNVFSNIFAPASGAVPKVLLDGFDGALDVSTAERKYSELFRRNSAQPVNFVVVAPSNRQDFMLANGSPGIDDGAFLTSVTATGKSTLLPVADTYFFSDGRGLVQGDLVQLEGSSMRAVVVRVDHSAKLLELDRAVDFRMGQGLALAYAGGAPDVGAFEYGFSNGAAPRPPTTLDVK